MTEGKTKSNIKKLKSSKVPVNPPDGPKTYSKLKTNYLFDSIDNFKRFKELTYKIAIIFKLFNFKWGFDNRVPTQQEIEDTFKELVKTCIEEKLKYAETGRLYVKKEEKNSWELGFKLEEYVIDYLT